MFVWLSALMISTLDSKLLCVIASLSTMLTSFCSMFGGYQVADVRIDWPMG